MNLATSVVAGLCGAVLLTVGQARGILLIEADPRGAGRSFWAIAFCVPIVVCLRLLEVGGPLPAAPLRAISRHVLVFVVAWLLFALLSHVIAPRFRRTHLWPHMIAAWNWCGVTENALLLIGAVPGLLGAPDFVDQAAQVFTFGWALWVEWYAIRLSFGAGPLLAAWLVMVDQTIGLAVTLLELIITAG